MIYATVTADYILVHVCHAELDPAWLQAHGVSMHYTYIIAAVSINLQFTTIKFLATFINLAC